MQINNVCNEEIVSTKIKQAILFLVTIVFCLSPGCSLTKDKREIRRLQDEIIRMKSIEKQNEFFSKRQEQLIERLSEQLKNLPVISDFEKEILQTRGLEDPEKQLAEDLDNHLALIPQNDEEEAKMKFLNVFVLSHKWVLASYGYDNIAGYVLLSFEVSEDGNISWQHMDSYLVTDIK